MRVLVTGATGFVGRSLVRRLLREHQVVASVRDRARARGLLGPGVELAASTADGLAGAVRGCDAVVNLAGESLVGARWTPARRQALVDSRVGLTRELVSAMGRATPPPSVLISTSAVGWYGDRGDELLTEESTPGSDFLAGLCRDWEAAAAPASALGTRVAILRFGVVLGRGGGALEKMLPAYRAGVGGPMGDGRAFLPWIHLDDLVEIIATVLVDPRYTGTLNATAPAPARGGELAKLLGEKLHRPAWLRVPRFALRIVLGGAASAVLASQRAMPARLVQLGFGFRFSTLDAALGDLVGGQPASSGELPAQG